MSEFVKSQNYICVSGYGWTGSSACIDILKEFKGFGALKGEFRIAKDPYGLSDLENSLVHNWDFMRNDVAIRDFLNYCEVLGRGTGLFKKTGKDLSRKLNIDFMAESRLYIDRLTDMTYSGDTLIHRYNISAYDNFCMKIKSKFGKNNGKFMYFSRPDSLNFIKETKLYIDNLFDSYMKINKINKVILDQTVPPTNIYNTSKYFENIKTIIIDRDPRDIYANMVRGKRLLGPELINHDSVEKYIIWHKQLRRISIKDVENSSKNTLRLYFEDLIFKYDETIEKIIAFLGDGAQHNCKGKNFLPELSINNTGLWKGYKDQSIMKKIALELEDYCYNV